MAIMFIGVNFLILILIQYSIRLSKLTDRFKDLTQQISIIDHELSVTSGDLYRINKTNKSYFYVLAASISARENYSRADIECKVQFNRILARKLGWGKEEVESLEFATILHDIGKINIPIASLYKTSTLSDSDWEKIKEHPLTSASILEGIPFLLASIPMIRSHHEHWDGSGYPEGLQGDEIPMGARILGLADSFIALISDRPYREALPLDEAADVLRKQSGKQFDPEVVEAMFDCWDEIKHVTQICRHEIGEGETLVDLEPVIIPEPSLIEAGMPPEVQNDPEDQDVERQAGD
jgi:HD-GYP domain-containing protein (c-di-GMP phosphodiesterase class II)